MVGSNGWIGNWSPGIGDPTFVGWLTVGFYVWAAWLCCQVLRLEHDLKLALSPEEKLYWPMLVVGLVLLGINKQLDLQTALTEIGRIIAVYQGWYERRREIQAEIVGLIVLLAFLMCLLLALLTRRVPMVTRVTLVGSVLLLAFVVVRAVSFHHVDEFIHYRVAGMRMNWIMEIGGLLVIGIGARLRARI
jgi:hypothetical protein